MTLLDILIRLKNEAPTTLTVEEELHLQRIERRRERGDPLGAVLMEEGVTPETLAALQSRQGRDGTCDGRAARTSELIPTH